ncbi:MAG: hypothetical protein COB15_03580 [Flavobacteriales bacterium]|nr:MAG: hypothetical protein COB15_03580 [Flavobacteriales bacterium]
MKKLLLSALALTTIVGTANAQIFTEDFTNGIPVTFTLTDSDGLTPHANVSTLTAAFNAGSGQDDNGLTKDCALSTSWFSSPAAADDWMVTPAIVLPVTTNQLVLEWNSMTLDAIYPDGLEVYISTTGTAPSDFITPAIYNTTATGEPSVWTAQQIDISLMNGQTIYVGFRNQSNDAFVLAVDDIVVRELFAVDGQMLSVNVPQYGTGGNVNIMGVVKNDGGNAITSYDISYTVNSGTPVVESFTNTIASGASYNFTLANPLTSVAGNTYNLDISIVVTGDGDASDDMLSSSHTALSSIPAKTNVGEELTGSWCQWCPRGAVGLAKMESVSDFIGIAVHNGDPMVVSAYDANLVLPNTQGYPHGGIDRVVGLDPGDFLPDHNARKTAIVPCAVNSITATYNPTTNMVAVSTVAEFFGTVSGNYRLSCVIVQDDLESTSAGWSQSNAYSGGGSGTMAFPAGINGGYDFSTGPGSVPAAAFGGYDHVARSLSNNDVMGNLGSLPASTVNMGTYNYSFTDVATSSMPGVGSAGFVAADAHAIVMIVNATTGEILNAGKATISVVTSSEEIADAKFNLSVYPNPTADIADVTFYLENGNTVKMEVYNAMGALVYTENAGNLTKGNHKMAFNGEELNSGFYFVNLTIGNKVITKKVTLTK